MSNVPTQSPSTGDNSFSLKDLVLVALVVVIGFLGYQLYEANRQRDEALKTVKLLNEQLAATKPAVSATADTVEAAAKAGKRVIGIMDGILDQVDPKSK